MNSPFTLKKDDSDNTSQNVADISKQDTSDNMCQKLDKELSKKIALSLLHAVSGQDVLKILKEHKALFDNSDNWQFNAKWSTAGNQQSSPAGAFTELVINSMDACLIKKAKERGIEDLRGDDVPQSMQEAVKLFYPDISEGKLTNLDSGHKNSIADQSIFIGIKRASIKYPTYTIVDFGEGQEPEDFKDTFVSVEDAKNNKEGILFVQGKFHMGSTGVFRFLTQSKYELGRCKLIISKHFKSDKWAWTLVRLRKPKSGDKNEELPIVEYFSPDKNCVPYFYADSIQSLEHKGINDLALKELNKQNVGIIEQGTIVKLYEFAMNNSKFTSNQGGLDNALTVSLIRCALPIRTYELDSSNANNLGSLGEYNVHKRAAFSGAVHYLHTNSTELMDGFPIAIPKISDPKLGAIAINVYAVAAEKDGKIEGLKDFLKKQEKRIFYTINGQVHATQNKSVINSKLKFGALEDHIIIEVVCDDIDKSQRHEIFLPDRERMSNMEISTTLKNTVKEALIGNSSLKELANLLSTKKAEEHSENDESAKVILQDMVNNNPEIGHLFGAGKDIKTPKASRFPDDDNYNGKQFPTKFECQRNGVVEIPINASKRIVITTDVANDYFSRLKDAGSFDYDNENINISKNNLKNGKFTITVKAWNNAIIGDKQDCTFSFSDCQNVDPLSCHIKMTIVKARITDNPSPQPPKKSKTPDIFLVNKEDQGFTAESGAKVVEDSEGGITIYVNRNNKYLESILKRESADRKQYYETAFKTAVGVQTFVLYEKFKNNESESSIYEKASSAIAMSMIAIIKQTGKQICQY
jgi:hypothetical protein